MSSENENENENENEINNKAANAAMSPRDGDAKAERAQIDAQKFLTAWNDACDKHKSSMPRVQSIGGRRLEHLRARLREYGEEAVLATISKAAASAFLNGGGNKGFVANFDWVMRPNNFPKVMEGNYDLHKPTQTGYNIGTTQIDNSISKWDGEAEKWKKKE